jgi:hypothetical protein
MSGLRSRPRHTLCIRFENIFKFGSKIRSAPETVRSVNARVADSFYCCGCCSRGLTSTKEIVRETDIRMTSSYNAATRGQIHRETCSPSCRATISFRRSAPAAAGCAHPPDAGLLLPSAVRSSVVQPDGSVLPPLRATSPPSLPSAAPSALPDFHPLPFPRAASRFAARVCMPAISSSPRPREYSEQRLNF